MKMLLTAIAFAFAAPAAAQAGQDPHAQHSAAEHAASQHDGHGGPAAAGGDHARHEGKHGAEHDGCCVKGADGKMVCKMKAGGKKPADGKAAHGDHGGH